MEQRPDPGHDALFEGPEAVMRVLLVGGSALAELTRGLARLGHELLAVGSDERSLRLIGVFDPDVIVIATPDARAVCRRLREAMPDAAIVALGGGRAPEERIAALDAGADDCLGTPCETLELDARLRAVRRRCTGAVPQARACEPSWSRVA